MTFYAILARSPSLNRTQRFLDEDEMKGRRTTSPQLARQKADAFAQRLNQQKMMGAADWSAQIELIDSPFRKL